MEKEVFQIPYFSFHDLSSENLLVKIYINKKKYPEAKFVVQKNELIVSTKKNKKKKLYFAT